MLRIGIDRDELNTFESDINHSIDCIHSAAANANNFDNSQVILWCSHDSPPYEL
jgi:hypothetical protein